MSLPKWLWDCALQSVLWSSSAMSIQTSGTSAPWSLVSASQDLSKFCVTWTRYFSQYWLHNLSLVKDASTLNASQGTELRMGIGGLTSINLVRWYDHPETNKITTQKPVSLGSIICWLLQKRIYRGNMFSAATKDLGRSCDKGGLLPIVVLSLDVVWTRLTQPHDLQMNFQMDEMAQINPQIQRPPHITWLSTWFDF